jgi:hypothetical protein
MGLINLWEEKTTSKTKNENVACQMLVVQFFYGIDNTLLLHQMEDELISELSKHNIGEHHGYDLSTDMGEGYLFIIGDNGELLFDVTKPIMEKYYFMDKSLATIRSASGNPNPSVNRDIIIHYSKFIKN